MKNSLFTRDNLELMYSSLSSLAEHRYILDVLKIIVRVNNLTLTGKYDNIEKEVKLFKPSSKLRITVKEDSGDAIFIIYIYDFALWYKRNSKILTSSDKKIFLRLMLQHLAVSKEQFESVCNELWGSCMRQHIQIDFLDLYMTYAMFCLRKEVSIHESIAENYTRFILTYNEDYSNGAIENTGTGDIIKIGKYIESVDLQVDKILYDNVEDLLLCYFISGVTGSMIIDMLFTIGGIPIKIPEGVTAEKVTNTKRFAILYKSKYREEFRVRNTV